MMGFVTLSDDPRTRALASSYSEERTAQLLDGRGSDASTAPPGSGLAAQAARAAPPAAAPRDTGHDSTRFVAQNLHMGQVSPGIADCTAREAVSTSMTAAFTMEPVAVKKALIQASESGKS